MIYIAKMHTRYPEFHGTGYYNFIMDDSMDRLEQKIEDNSHDFRLEGVVKTRFKSTNAVVNRYLHKQDLNAKYFDSKAGA